MKKGLYFVFSDINFSEPDGIEKKMIAQKRMFCELGIDMSFERLEYRHGTDWNYKPSYGKVDFVYFRKETVVEWRMISFLKKLKEEGNPVIFMEIPTYPYDGEFGNSLRSKITLKIDHFFRKKMYKYIDRIVVTGMEIGSTLWGVKTVCVVNGIDLSSVPVRRYKAHDGTINLLCVAKFSPWHGYERLIMGLRNYYDDIENKRIVKILMVGEGVEKDYYQKLVEENNLSEYIRFYGKLTGNKLDNIYDQTDIGICSLGRYKSGIDVIGDLKSRDLMAKGIPMLCGCQIDILVNKDYKYACYVPNDNSIININDIISYYVNLLKDSDVKDITNSIRKEAERLIDFSVTYQKVLNTLKEILWEK